MSRSNDGLTVPRVGNFDSFLRRTGVKVSVASGYGLLRGGTEHAAEGEEEGDREGPGEAAHRD